MSTTDFIIRLFAVIGIGVIVAILAGLIAILVTNINEYIDAKKYEYKRKHRFDKPPTAQCYCIDCVYREEDGLCCKGTINHCIDCWFCGDAIPKKHDTEATKR